MCAETVSTFFFWKWMDFFLSAQYSGPSQCLLKSPLAAMISQGLLGNDPAGLAHLFFGGCLILPDRIIQAQPGWMGSTDAKPFFFFLSTPLRRCSIGFRFRTLTDLSPVFALGFCVKRSWALWMGLYQDCSLFSAVFFALSRIISPSLSQNNIPQRDAAPTAFWLWGEY